MHTDHLNLFDIFAKDALLPADANDREVINTPSTRSFSQQPSLHGASQGMAAIMHAQSRGKASIAASITTVTDAQENQSSPLKVEVVAREIESETSLPPLREYLY